MATTDVTIVGGGIAGASLAYALAREGLGVTVLEASTEFPDRVRGESMQCWGVLEARELGVEDILLAAGAHMSPLWKQYMEGVPDPIEIPVGLLLPEVSGTLNLRHPTACQALLDAAAGAGAVVHRGAQHIDLRRDGEPVVGFDIGEDSHEVRCSLVVGADGRNSTVRRQAGLALEREEPTTFIAGLLVDGLADVPDGFDAIATEERTFFLLFHQGQGRARVYVCGDLSDQARFVGPDAATHLLEACDVACFPWREQVMAASPAGPCASYPGDDTWTAQPAADRVVLIGDAAGHNDPIIGQGLSIAMRDARSARDLVLDGARDAADFAGYAAERVERMARLRLAADVMAAVHAEAADNATARRAWFVEGMSTMKPDLFPVVIAAFVGPETTPPEAVDPGLVDRIRAL